MILSVDKAHRLVPYRGDESLQGRIDELACVDCNLNKESNLTGIDPASRKA